MMRLASMMALVSTYRPDATRIPAAATDRLACSLYRLRSAYRYRENCRII